MWNPIPEISVNAIKAYFYAMWTGLTSELVSKQIKPSTATTKVHQRAARKNARYTRQGTPRSESHEMNSDPIPVQEIYFYTKFIQINGKVFSDQTGISPFASNRGKKSSSQFITMAPTQS